MQGSNVLISTYHHRQAKRGPNMKIPKMAWSFLGILLLGGGCTIIHSRSETRYAGTQVSDVTMARLEIGKTTKAWVIATLGAPTTVSQVDDRTELLKYTATRTTDRHAGMILIINSREKTEERETVYLEFRDEVLRRYWKADD
jgi:outer membrane protein assembly factor BamE (lipoprotein component of BamABCDE complex)